MTERTHWVVLRRPGNVPVRNGPFSPNKELGEFIREVMAGRPGDFITVLAMQDGEPEVYDGPEWLECRDGRSAPLARKHRESTRYVTQAEASAKDARIAELEARILELETVTDEQVERAAQIIAYEMGDTMGDARNVFWSGYNYKESARKAARAALMAGR